MYVVYCIVILTLYPFSTDFLLASYWPQLKMGPASLWTCIWKWPFHYDVIYILKTGETDWMMISTGNSFQDGQNIDMLVVLRKTSGLRSICIKNWQIMKHCCGRPNNCHFFHRPTDETETNSAIFFRNIASCPQNAHLYMIMPYLPTDKRHFLQFRL